MIRKLWDNIAYICLVLFALIWLWGLAAGLWFCFGDHFHVETNITNGR